MTRDEFTEVFGGMYEHSPWAARGAWRENLARPSAIIAAMKACVDAAEQGQIDTLICAHPDLAGKLALSGTLTASSSAEQAGAGLDQCSADELSKFQKYNAAYKDKFGLPFIIAVKGLGRQEILASFEARLENDKPTERAAALAQIHKIARLRIQTHFASKEENTESQDMNTPDFTQMTNLAARRLGSEVVYATDDFFADKARLIDPAPPVFIDDKYDDNGKWMDGWESRRKRVAGHDWAVIKLGRSGRVSGFALDTANFTGNFPPFASIELANCVGDPTQDDWHEVVAKTGLKGDSLHYYAVETDAIWTHVRLHIYPDGGVARLRVYGRVFIDWDSVDAQQEIDLAALNMGGQALYANDIHFGVPENLIAPGKGINMGDGWETRRRRELGNDWAVLALAHAGTVERIVIDTAYFKGNYPDRTSIQAINAHGLSSADLIASSQNWPELLPPQKMEMDREFTFTEALNDLGPITHIRLNIFPDGGISRLRVFGKIFKG